MEPENLITAADQVAEASPAAAAEHAPPMPLPSPENNVEDEARP